MKANNKMEKARARSVTFEDAFPVEEVRWHNQTQANISAFVVVQIAQFLL
jgi:hypothetical protein